MRKDIKRLASRIGIGVYHITRSRKPPEIKVKKWRLWWIAATVGIVTLVVILALLLPTPSPSPPPPTPTPTPPPTPAPTPPAPTSPRTIPPSEIKEGLMVLSHSSYVDDFGYFHLVGEVENIGSLNTELNKVTVTFFDSEGNAVVTASNYTYLDILKPGRKSPFEIVLSAPPPVANYKLESTWRITNRGPYTDLNIEGITLEREEQGWGYLSGQVRNTGNESVDVIIIVGTFYDTDGKVVGASFTFSEVLPLKPGGSSPFMMVVDPQVTRAMETYSLQAEGYKEG